MAQEDRWVKTTIFVKESTDSNGQKYYLAQSTQPEVVKDAKEAEEAERTAMDAAEKVPKQKRGRYKRRAERDAASTLAAEADGSRADASTELVQARDPGLYAETSAAKDAPTAKAGPSMEVPLDAEGARKVMRVVDALEDCDDVQNVYTNADISDEVLAEPEDD